MSGRKTKRLSSSMPRRNPTVGGETADGEEADGLGPTRRSSPSAALPVEPEDDEDDAIKPLPDRLITELTAHRTLALRNALANNPAVAFAAVLHNFVLATFYRFASSSGCLEIAVRSPTLPPQAPGLNDSASAKAIDTRHDAWKVRLPKEEGDLWDALIAFDATEQSSCSRIAPRSASTRSMSRPIATMKAASPRMAFAAGSTRPTSWRASSASTWSRQAGRPSVDNYLGRVTKPRILEAVREAKGESSAQLIDHLKKGDMAREAERLLEGTGWLPEPLRLADTEAVTDAATSEAEALPEFLADDDEVEAEPTKISRTSSRPND